MPDYSSGGNVRRKPWHFALPAVINAAEKPVLSLGRWLTANRHGMKNVARVEPTADRSCRLQVPKHPGLVGCP